MSLQWNELNEGTRSAMSAGFAVRRQAARLAGEMTEAVTVRGLYGYALDPASDVDGRVQRALDTDPMRRDEWNRVLRWLGAELCESRAAAASDALHSCGSSPDGAWSYELKRSPQAPFEHILIIDVVETRAPPRRLEAVSEHHGRVDIELEPPHRGVIQMIFDADDPVGVIFSDPDRRVRMW